MDPIREETHEVLEAVGSQVHVSHGCEKPDDGIGDGLSETGPDTGIAFVAYGVFFHTGMSKKALFLCQPVSELAAVSGVSKKAPESGLTILWSGDSQEDRRIR